MGKFEMPVMMRGEERNYLHVVFPTPPLPPTNTHRNDSWSRILRIVGSKFSMSSPAVAILFVRALATRGQSRPAVSIVVHYNSVTPSTNQSCKIMCGIFLCVIPRIASSDVHRVKVRGLLLDMLKLCTIYHREIFWFFLNDTSNNWTWNFSHVFLH